MRSVGVFLLAWAQERRNIEVIGADVIRGRNWPGRWPVKVADGWRDAKVALFRQIRVGSAASFSANRWPSTSDAIPTPGLATNEGARSA